MKLLIVPLSLLIALGLFSANAAVEKKTIKIIPKVIYGNDDRQEVFESSSSLMRELSRSTAAKVLNANLYKYGEIYSLDAKSLEEEGVCSEERFARQYAAADCSGFLVSPDTLVTAGHCINTAEDCQKHFWVFDYSNMTKENYIFNFAQNQVYRCTAIIEREIDLVNRNDYAVLKLDRPVLGRTPLQFRKSGKIASSAILTVIGHPSGLPAKITSNARIRENNNEILFKINSDTYAGNSGSAVFDSKTGLVEGILVRGDKDYDVSDTADCLNSVHRGEYMGRGEDVTRITNIKALKK